MPLSDKYEILYRRPEHKYKEKPPYTTNERKLVTIEKKKKKN